MSNSTILYYGDEHEDFSKNNYGFCPLVSKTEKEKYHWSCKLNSFSMIFKEKILININMSIVFDTGTNGIVLPKYVLSFFKNDLKKYDCKILNIAAGMSTIICYNKSDLPNLFLEIGEYSLMLDKNIISYEKKISNYTFYPLYIFFEEGIEIGIIGLPFFYQFHTRFDLENNLIKFYNNINTINKINKTNKIIIKSGEKELGVIKDTNKIEEILDAVSSANRYGEVCLSDGHGFDFEMYNDNKLIDTIQVWGDGKRILPESVNGCYYSISNGTDLRKIIEDETDYIFYSILDYSETCAEALELVYENNGNKYYLSCIKSDKVMIKFMINNKVMTLKSALENNLITADKIASEYPDILIKEWSHN